ncbi:MAG TPA: hypothetical protein VIN01_09715 [Candidatus Dormibacteraeota bacterium]|jgi:hypothetical protein
MTAIACGRRKDCIADRADSRSRSSNLRRASGEREVGNSIRISPEPDRLRIGNPLSRKTSSIWRFSPRIVASNSSIPVADAVAASWPRRIVPRPRPCISSATAKPTSARWGLTVP